MGRRGRKPLSMDEFVERFCEHVNENGPLPSFRPDLGPCHLWTGPAHRGRDGFYGTSNWGGRQWYVHRLALHLVGDEIPERHDVDHLCRVTLCVRRSHLEAVTHRENCLRGFGLHARLARQTHCIHDHELTPENLLVQTNGGRGCKACHYRRNRERGRARNARKREARCAT